MVHKLHSRGGGTYVAARGGQSAQSTDSLFGLHKLDAWIQQYSTVQSWRKSRWYPSTTAVYGNYVHVKLSSLERHSVLLYIAGGEARYYGTSVHV